MANLAERLKALREERGMLQKDLAERMEIPRATIASWESRNRVPDVAKIELLADFFDVSVDYLLGRSEVRNPGWMHEAALRIYEEIQGRTELEEIFRVLAAREDMVLLLSKVKSLPPESIDRIIQVIDLIEGRKRDG